MNARAAQVVAPLVVAALVCAGGAGAAWWAGLLPGAQAGQAASEETPAPGEDLPIPPVPPRVAEGDDYERCLAMVNDDPDGADAFADAWEATGGGEGAAHCHALAQVALGNAEDGAAMLEKLALTSKAPALARAAVWGQAAQSWMIAGDPNRALAADTRALVLSPDDPDLLIDRSVAAGNTDDFAGAVADLTHALEVDPHRVDALVLRGAAWRHLRHPEREQDDIDRAFALDPENPEALLERGILRQQAGDVPGARQDWQDAASLAPDTPTADLAQQNLALLEAGPDRR